jgi:hypothetical protein
MKAIFVTALVLAVCAVHANLDYKRVHIVDRSGSNWLFRSNMPTNETTFAYDQLLQYMGQRAKEANLTFPVNPYLIVISLNNDFDGKDFKKEREFWEKAPKTLGHFINWPLGLAGLLPPSWYTEQKRREMANSTVWLVDKIPDRVQDIRNLLLQQSSRPTVIDFHCSAGCDRTGEVAGCYRMQYTLPNVTAMYNLNCNECGRPPNYFSTTAQEWYCYYEQYRFGTKLGDCMGFAKCKMFGDCEPTHPGSSNNNQAEAQAPPTDFKVPESPLLPFSDDKLGAQE